MVARLDRLARSTRDLLNVLASVADKGARFRSIRDTWADTTTPHGELMLTVLGGLAEFERELIRTRTSEGRERAKSRGVKLGRRFKLSADQRAFVSRERAKGESTRHRALLLVVSRATIGRISPLAGTNQGAGAKVIPMLAWRHRAGCPVHPRKSPTWMRTTAVE